MKQMEWKKSFTITQSLILPREHDTNEFGLTYSVTECLTSAFHAAQLFYLLHPRQINLPCTDDLILSLHYGNVEINHTCSSQNLKARLYHVFSSVVVNSQWVTGGYKYYYARSDTVTRILSWGYYLIYSTAKKESTGKKFQELCRCVTYTSSSKFFCPENGNWSICQKHSISFSVWQS
jgi:hypothetical protein